MSTVDIQCNLTGGTVSVEDGRKATEEYAPARKVRLDLEFSFMEGAEAEAQARLDAICDLASSRVARLLGSTAVQAPAAPAEQAPPKTRKKAEKPAEETKVETPADEWAEDAAVETNTVVEAPADEWDAKPATVDADPITDADLNAKVTAKNADLKNPTLIRQLIWTFSPDFKADEPTNITKPFQLAEIAADRREDFLVKLAALKA